MNNPQDPPLPIAQTRTSKGLSLVWLIPIFALLTGSWLVYTALSKKGPTVVIRFNQAEGLEAGKTRIKYKEVEVGKVKTVALSDDLNNVLVTAELSSNIGSHLNENSRFWIVKPRINQSGVSGLSTLISGIYIGMDPADGNTAPDEFTGLETPPEVDSNAAGRQFTLRAEKLGSLDIGSPVYYRQIRVGEVTQYELEGDGNSVRISIFVEDPYQDLIRTTSRFWNASGFTVDFNTRGVSANLESLSALLSGGIAVDTPLNIENGNIAPSNSVFPLHENLSSIDDQPYQRIDFYVMEFDSSLRGLNKKAPVEFRGIKIGEVIDIRLEMDPETMEIKMPVFVGLYPERINKSNSVENIDDIMPALVKRGLRAQLKSGNLISGQLYIDLEMRDDAPETEIAQAGPYRIFPTVPPTLEKITRNVTDLLSTFGDLPIKAMTDDLHATIRGLNRIVNQKPSKTPKSDIGGLLRNVKELSAKLNDNIDPITQQLKTSLDQVETTLASTERVINEDSPLYYDLRRLIDELSSAARSFETLTEYIERHPNALLMGRPDE